jgi:hypothetical protein
VAERDDTLVCMKARVRNRRLVLDEPTDLPEGTEIELVPVDDELDDDDKRRLHEALAESDEDAAAGRVHAAPDVLAEVAELSRRS